MALPPRFLCIGPYTLFAGVFAGVDVKAILTLPVYFFYGESLMEYTGRRQNNFNAHAQVFALDVGRPYNAAATASAPRGSANPSDPVSPCVIPRWSPLNHS